MYNLILKIYIFQGVQHVTGKNIEDMGFTIEAMAKPLEALQVKILKKLIRRIKYDYNTY